MTVSWRATWDDIKLLVWVILLLWAFIGVLGLLSRDYFGPYTLRVVLGLAALVTVVLGSIAAASLLVSLAADLMHWVRRSRRHVARR